MSMEFWETVGQVTLCVLIAVIAAGFAVAIAMLLGLLAAIVKNELDEKDDTEMPKGKNCKPVLKSLKNVRERVMKHGGNITFADNADICQEAVEVFGAPLLNETITSLDLPYVAAALRFWADKAEQLLDVVDRSETAKKLYRDALKEMNENIETATMMQPRKCDE